MDESQDERWRDVTLAVDDVVRLALRWLPFMTAGSFLPYLILWGLPGWPEWEGLGDALFSALAWTLVALLVYVVSALLHEALHVLAMIGFARVPISTIRFGMRLSEGVLYVHTTKPMSVRAYRTVLLLPGLLQGIVPLVAGTGMGVGWLVLYGYVMLVSASGDLAVLQLLRPLAPGDLVRDHPHAVGCRVRAADGGDT